MISHYFRFSLTVPGVYVKNWKTSEALLLTYSWFLIIYWINIDWFLAKISHIHLCKCLLLSRRISAHIQIFKFFSSFLFLDFVTLFWQVWFYSPLPSRLPHLSDEKKTFSSIFWTIFSCMIWNLGLMTSSYSRKSDLWRHISYIPKWKGRYSHS